MHLIFFILSPFLTFLYSCFDLRKRSAQIVFVLFFGLFGYCHTFEDTRADSFRKHESFTNYAAQEIDDIYINFRTGQTKDIYEDLLFSTVKRFTDNPHIMMSIVGLFGGFFYMLVVKRFLKDKKIEYTWPIIIILIFLVIESNIPIMGGIRNFSAFPLFVYSMIKLLIDNKKIWILGLLVTPLIHFGYIIVVLATIIIWIIKLPNNLMHYIALIMCISSIFLDTSSYVSTIDVATDSIDNEAITDRVYNYSEEDTDERFTKSLTTRLVRVNNQIGAVYIAALLIYLRRNRDSLISSPYIQKIYHYLLFFIIFSYALISFSVVGQRYVYIAFVLLYFLLLNVYQEDQNSAIKIFMCAMPIVFSIHILWTIYNCYCNTGLDIYYQPLPLLTLQHVF